MRNKYTIFRKFVERIVEEGSREAAVQEVFYGISGIDMAFQRGEISWEDHELLLKLIERIQKEV